MASNNPKTPGTRVQAGPLPNKTAPSSTGGAAGSEWTAEDRKLLGYVKTNAQTIVVALTRTSSEAGFRRDYPAMHEYREIASKISDLCGLGQLAESSAAMATR